jgi:hypothetical protein
MNKRNKKAERAAREKAIGRGRALARANTAVFEHKRREGDAGLRALARDKAHAYQRGEFGPERATAQRTSPLQESILEALKLLNTKGAEFIFATGEIMKCVGLIEPTLAERAAASRSLARLADRGLIERYEAVKARPGNGSLWRIAPASQRD